MTKRTLLIAGSIVVSLVLGGAVPAQADTGSSAPVEKAPAPGTRSADLEATTGLRFDNNAFADRRGQFGADAVTHIVGLLGVSGTFEAQLYTWLSFTLDSSVDLEELRLDTGELALTDDLRKTSVSLDPSLVFEPLSRLEISLTPALQIVRESDQVWSFLQLAPALEVAYVTPCGLHASLGYTFTGKYYDSKAPTETYGNVDMTSHRGELNLKFWPIKQLRTRVTATLDRQSYDKNLGELLGRIVFLPIEEFEDPDAEFVAKRRHDWNLQTEAELVYVPFDWGLVAAGYRFESVTSSLDPFTYRGHGPRVALAAKYKSHEAYAEAKITFKDFYDFRFDTRYSDTRRDYKLDLYAAYGYVIKSWVRLDLTYSYLRNDSNDALFFSFGHSRSYSLYQRSKVELTATFRFDFLHKPPAPKRPELPGTLLAGR